jgi:RNA polymerase sigma-70 factor (ECF subfamily)
MAMPSHLESTADLRALSDEELARKLAHGCDDALAVLYERHAPSILSLAKRVIGDLSEAEDTVQQVFLELHRSAGRMGEAKGSVRSWLHSRGFRRALNKREHLERRGFYKSQDLNHVEAELIRGSGAHKYFPPELSCLVDELLAHVSELEREVIRLYLFERMTMKQIASQVNRTYAVVRHNFYNGLNKMRSLLDEREGL